MEDLYFISEEVKIIFGLVELAGKAQMDFLGIAEIHYFNRERAKSWYQEIKGMIENSKHPNVKIAMESLNKIYKGMGGKIK